LSGVILKKIIVIFKKQWSKRKIYFHGFILVRFGFEVLILKVMKTSVFWDITPCNGDFVVRIAYITLYWRGDGNGIAHFQQQNKATVTA
jgi:hypothetical protein